MFCVNMSSVLSCFMNTTIVCMVCNIWMCYVIWIKHFFFLFFERLFLCLPSHFSLYRCFLSNVSNRVLCADCSAVILLLQSVLIPRDIEFFKKKVTQKRTGKNGIHTSVACIRFEPNFSSILCICTIEHIIHTLSRSIHKTIVQQTIQYHLNFLLNSIHSWLAFSLSYNRVSRLIDVT